MAEQGFTTDLLTEITNASAEKTIAKGEFLLREGETEKHLYTIAKGAVRIFYLTEFDEHTIRFGYEGSVINSLSSFIKNAPSEFYVQAIRKTYVRQIKRDDFFRIVFETPEKIRQYSQILETALVRQIDREIDLLTSTPAERLNRVLKRSPDLFQHIPLKYIASYLRMTPETLSRIRNS